MHVREERVLEYLSDCVAAWWVIDCPCCRCEFVWLLSRIPSKILKMYFSRCIYINMHINLRKWLPRKKIRVEVGCVVWGSVLLRAWECEWLGEGLRISIMCPRIVLWHVAPPKLLIDTMLPYNTKTRESSTRHRKQKKKLESVQIGLEIFRYHRLHL